MTLRNPGLFFRLLILGAQGVFYNLFCMLSIDLPVLLMAAKQYHLSSSLLLPHLPSNLPQICGIPRRRSRYHLLPLHTRNGSRSSATLVRLLIPHSPSFNLLNQLNVVRTDRQDMPAPEIAKDYWRLGPDATMLDVIYAVRSDESTHRFVNHSLANLGKDDVNPFALREPDMHVKGKVVEFGREDAARYVQESHTLFDKQKKALEH